MTSSRPHAVPSYFEGAPSDFVAANLERHAADGLPVAELLAAGRAVTDWDQWVGYWLDRAGEIERAADDSDASEVTAVGHLVTASLAAHVAQYLHFHEPEVRRAALERKIALYRRAAPRLDPPGRPIEIPFGHASLPGYLRTPSDRLPVPCVVYVGGLDAHKEDAHAFGELLVRRGLAVLAFDGPGQGEALLRGMTFGPDAHAAVSAAVAAAADDAGVDAARIAVIGRSLGGYLAPRAAADDHRVRALAVWGAMHHIDFAPFPRHTRAGFVAISGSSSEAEAAERLAFADLTGHASRIQCPTLIVHGELDALCPPALHAEPLAAEVADCRLEIVERSPHCNHDHAHFVRPFLADWLAEALRR